MKKIRTRAGLSVLLGGLLVAKSASASVQVSQIEAENSSFTQVVKPKSPAKKPVKDEQSSHKTTKSSPQTQPFSVLTQSIQIFENE